MAMMVVVREFHRQVPLGPDARAAAIPVQHSHLGSPQVDEHEQTADAKARVGKNVGELPLTFQRTQSHSRMQRMHIKKKTPLPE